MNEIKDFLTEEESKDLDSELDNLKTNNQKLNNKLDELNQELDEEKKKDNDEQCNCKNPIKIREKPKNCAENWHGFGDKYFCQKCGKQIDDGSKKFKQIRNNIFGFDN